MISPTGIMVSPGYRPPPFPRVPVSWIYHPLTTHPKAATTSPAQASHMRRQTELVGSPSRSLDGPVRLCELKESGKNGRATSDDGPIGDTPLSSSIPRILGSMGSCSPPHGSMRRSVRLGGFGTNWNAPRAVTGPRGWAPVHRNRVDGETGPRPLVPSRVHPSRFRRVRVRCGLPSPGGSTDPSHGRFFPPCPGILI